MPHLIILRTAVLLLACLCGPLRVWSQTPARLTVSRELQGNAVYHCYKDRRGFLWFCTDRGVTRYNGRDFKTFSVSDGLPDNNIFNAYEDDAQRLWLFAYNGSSCYLKQDSIFTRANSPLLRALPAIPYLNLMLDLPGGELLFGYFTGQYLKIGPKGLLWIRAAPQGDNYPVTAINSGNYTTIVASKDISYYQDRRLTPAVHRHIIQAAYQYHCLAIADSAGIHLYKRNKLVRDFGGRELAKKNITNLLLDVPAGRLFCSTLNGLFMFDLRSGRRQEWFHGKAVTSTVADDAGNYWITTSRDGIYSLSHDPGSIRTITGMSGYRITQQANGQVFSSTVILLI